MSALKKITAKKTTGKSGRGPGRPRKNKETHKLPKLGIVDEPSNLEIFDPDDHEKEMDYCISKDSLLRLSIIHLWISTILK